MINSYVRSALLSTLVVFLLIAAVPAGAVGATSGAGSSIVSSEVSPKPGCNPYVNFNVANFPTPTSINNVWLPLVPGTQFVLEGRANRGGGSLPHRVTFTVTDLTKVINGVNTVVLYDVDSNAGEIVEAELAFFAQDNARNVWVFGEYPEEYEGGVFVGAPSTWISGQAGAEAGVLVSFAARVGTPSWRQGFAPAIDFYDCGDVFKTGERICVPTGCYDNVLVVDEWSPLEQHGGHQLKYYAPGVGNIQIGAVADPEAETLVLVEVRGLSGQALTSVRRAALDLERRAYQVSPVYGQTAPMQRLP